MAAKMTVPPKLVRYRILYLTLRYRILYLTHSVLFLRAFSTGEKSSARNQGNLLGFSSWYLTRPRILIASAALVVTDQLREWLIPSAPMQT